MRWLLACIVIATTSLAARAADVEIVRVWPRWHNAGDFDRIENYFGHPTSGGEGLVVRSHADQLAGLYFLVRVKTPNPVAGAKLILDVIRPDSPDPKRYTFPVSFPRKGGVAEVGLTDGDWPGGQAMHPVAWKLTLLSAGGAELASRQSFLWAKPGS
ncbi:MAG TPA: hypothetical protein VHE61_01025 [Opitutaceae bacterium]|nr:hypothetical protein [Opitutaceae bacterium]